MNRQRDLVQSRIRLDTGRQRFTNLDSRHRFRTLFSARDSKGALVRKAIQYPFPGRQQSDFLIVVDLIEIKSGFLSAQKL
jgi:hypothetical protein